MDTSLSASTSVGAIGNLSSRSKRERGQRSGVLSSAGLAGQSMMDGTAVESKGALATHRSFAPTVDLETLSDTAVVEIVLAGDSEAFAALVERYKDAVQNLAYRMLGNVTEAEDVTQEVFVRAYTQLATYKPAHKFSTWLLSIASHLSIDQLRRRRFLALPLEDVPFLEWIADVGTGPEQSALAGEQHDEIQHYLQRLPGKYRAVIVLRYWYDFSYEEIAQMLCLTPALVKARLHRARELLARSMKEKSLNEEGRINALSQS